jgi:hypothetical protein
LKRCFEGGVYLPLIISNSVSEFLGPMSNLKFLVSLKLLEGDSNKIFISSINLFINKKNGATVFTSCIDRIPIDLYKTKEKLIQDHVILTMKS